MHAILQRLLRRDTYILMALLLEKSKYLHISVLVVYTVLVTKLPFMCPTPSFKLRSLQSVIQCKQLEHEI